MSYVAIIQARMGSTRLTGKVMRLLNGEPVLAHVVARAKSSKQFDRVVVATTNSPEDEIINSFCCENSIEVFRGSEKDVLDRFYQTAKKFDAKVVARICSDCPLLDPNVIEQIILRYKLLNDKQNQVDYLSNTIRRTFPRGLDVEIINFQALEKAHRLATKVYEKMHVTPFIYQHEEDFYIHHFIQDTDWSGYRWTLDTQADYAVLSHIFKKLSITSTHIVSSQAVIEFLQAHPEISSMNRHIRQKSLQEC